MATVSKLSNVHDAQLRRNICVQKIARFHQEDYLISRIFHSRAKHQQSLLHRKKFSLSQKLLQTAVSQIIQNNLNPTEKLLI